MSKKKVKGPTKSKAQMEAELSTQMNTPIDNTNLKDAMDRFANQKTRENEAEVFKLLSEANLLNPVMIEGGLNPVNGKVAIPDPKAIKHILINTPDGKMFLPAFTGIEEAKKMPANENEPLTYLANNLERIESMLKNNGKVLGVVINPSSNNLVLPTALISKILHEEEEKAKQEEALRRGEIPAGMRVSYHEPAVYPTALANAVYEACQDMENVERVWLKGMQMPVANGFALFMETNEENEENRMKLLEAANNSSRGVPVLLVNVTEDIMKNVIQDAVPVYDKAMEF